MSALPGRPASAATHPSRRGGRSPLAALARLAEGAGAEAIAREARDAADRLEAGRFHVACIGQFKRGKSTLLNALVGESILPVGVRPVTSAIAILRSGPRGAVVRFDDGRTEPIDLSAVHRYVSEEANPENRLGVRAVEISTPSRLLQGGLCLVDTPGVGSILAGNAAVTRRFVPQIDAALLVVGADPPITADEVSLVEEVAAGAGHLLLVLNKADRASPGERAESLRFAAEVLSRRLHRGVDRAFEVSATGRPVDGAGTRGLPALEEALLDLARSGGADLLAASSRRARRRIAGALDAELLERRAALTRPLAASAARLEALGAWRSEVDRARADLGALLASEEARLSESWVARFQAALPALIGDAGGELRARLGAIHSPRLRHSDAALEVAIDLAAERAERFASEQSPAAEGAYRAAMERFVDLANDFLRRAASSGLVAPRPIGAEAGFRVRGELRFTALRYRTTRLPLAPLLDLLLPRRVVERLAARRAGAHLARLVEANCSRVAFDLVERAAASRRSLEREVRGRLDEVLAVAREAIADARRRRAEGGAAVDEALRRIGAWREELAPHLAAPVTEEAK